MANDLFETIENIFTKHEPVTTETDFKDMYMAIKFLSLHPASFYAAEEANRLSTKLPNGAVLCYLHGVVPKSRQPRFNYPKADKETGFAKELVEAVISNFYCSKHHAVQIINILNKIDPMIIESLGVEVKKRDSDNRKVSKQKRS